MLDADPVIADVIRGGFLECVHRGRVVVTDPAGGVRFALGRVDEPMYPRSSSKPMQALAMLRNGLDLSGRLLALAAASHAGERIHLDGVQEILAGAGLSVADLQNTPDYPLDDAARDEWVRAGRGRESLAQNCSGKHAAMLRTCVRAGWPTADYLDPAHPLQQAIAQVQAECAGSASAVTVDGCGAPLFAVPLSGLARTFGRLAAASEGPEKALADAYREFPEMVSGAHRDEVVLHRAVPGLMAKGGAEGCLAIGLADGTGIAIKSDDGAARGLMPVAVLLLRRLGRDEPGLAALASGPVLGHGEPVGAVVPHEASFRD